MCGKRGADLRRKLACPPPSSLLLAEIGRHDSSFAHPCIVILIQNYRYPDSPSTPPGERGNPLAMAHAPF
jgi:hypothetical protein